MEQELPCETCDPVPQGRDLEIEMTARRYCDLDSLGRLRVHVANSGDVSVAASTTRITFTPGGAFDVPTGPLAAGADTTLSVNIPPACNNNNDCDFTIKADNPNLIVEVNETNNSASGFCAPDLVPLPKYSGATGYCDLQIGGLGVRVKNTSSAYSSSPTTVQVTYGSGAPVAPVALPALGPNAETTISVPIPPDAELDFGFTICVDNGNLVREVSETNNVVSDYCIT